MFIGGSLWLAAWCLGAALAPTKFSLIFMRAMQVGCLCVPVLHLEPNTHPTSRYRVLVQQQTPRLLWVSSATHSLLITTINGEVWHSRLSRLVYLFQQSTIRPKLNMNVVGAPVGSALGGILGGITTQVCFCLSLPILNPNKYSVVGSAYTLACSILRAVWYAFVDRCLGSFCRSCRSSFYRRGPIS